MMSYNTNDTTTLTALEKINPEDRKKWLADRIVKLIGKPVDSLAVCALLESLGYREQDIVDNPSNRSLFEFSEEVYHICLKQHQLSLNLRPAHRTSILREEYDIKKSETAYGFVFFIHFFSQLAVLFAFRHALWASLDFTELEATIVAGSAILSFISTGGFIHAFNKEASFYFDLDNMFYVKNTIYLFLRLSGAALIIMSVILIALNFMFKSFEPVSMMYGLGYYVLLSLLWIYLAVLLTTRQFLIAIMAPIIGLIPLHLVIHFTNLGILTAQLTGLVFTNIILIGYTHFLIFTNQKKHIIFYDESLKSIYNPHIRQLSFYAASGFLFYLFFFSDRIICWTEGGLKKFWFQTSYELGLDWAFLSFIIMSFLLEYLFRRFSLKIIYTQDEYLSPDTGRYNSRLFNLYIRMLIEVGVIGLTSIVVVYYGIGWLQNYDHIEEIRSFFNSPVTYFTFYIASCGYFFFAIGSLNGLIFFTLARPKLLLKSMIPALILNIFIGIWLSQVYSSEFAIVGMATGALLYAILSSIYAMNLFRSIDYYYYSGF